MQISEVVALPIEQRVHAMELLWDSLARDPSFEPSPDWHTAVLAERRAELDRGETLAWDEARHRLVEMAGPRR
jgi:hypothetical protein